MFRTIVTLFALLPLVLVAQTGSAADKGRLWRVESAQHQVSYLFGTMHSDDPRVTELPALVNAAFTGATSVTLEMERAVDAGDGREDVSTRERVAGLDTR